MKFVLINRLIVLLHWWVFAPPGSPRTQNSDSSKISVILFCPWINLIIRIVLLIEINGKLFLQVYWFYSYEWGAFDFLYFSVFLVPLGLTCLGLVFFWYFGIVWKEVTLDKEVVLDWWEVLYVGSWVGLESKFFRVLLLLFLVLEKFDFVEIQKKLIALVKLQFISEFPKIGSISFAFRRPVNKIQRISSWWRQICNYLWNVFSRLRGPNKGVNEPLGGLWIVPWSNGKTSFDPRNLSATTCALI